MDDTGRIERLEQQVAELVGKLDRVQGTLEACKFLMLHVEGGFGGTPEDLQKELAAIQADPSFGEAYLRAFVEVVKDIKGRGMAKSVDRSIVN